MDDDPKFTDKNMPTVANIMHAVDVAHRARHPGARHPAQTIHHARPIELLAAFVGGIIAGILCSWG
jgi:hypothetical protein